MVRLFVIFLSLAFSIAFAYSDERILGDEATAIQVAGKTYHQGVSMIRKMHPEFLLHKRDKTSRQGVRTKEHSLKGCVSCHASKDENINQYHPVNQKNQFCSDCHQQLSVTIDCFGCHRTRPGKSVLNKMSDQAIPEAKRDKEVK